MKERLKHIRTLLSNVKRALKFAIYQNDQNTVEFPGEIPTVGDEVVAYDVSGNKIEKFTQDIVVKIGDMEYHVKIVDNIVKEVIEKKSEAEQTQAQAQTQSEQTQSVQMSGEVIKSLEEKISQLTQKINQIETKFSAVIKANEQMVKTLEMSAPAVSVKEEKDFNDEIKNLRKKMFNY